MAVIPKWNLGQNDKNCVIVQILMSLIEVLKNRLKLVSYHNKQKGGYQLLVKKASHDFSCIFLLWSQIKSSGCNRHYSCDFLFSNSGTEKLNWPDIKGVPDWLIGSEQAVKHCYYLSSHLLTCSPLRWAGLQPEVSLWLPGPHQSDHLQHHHHSGQAAQPL